MDMAIASFCQDCTGQDTRKAVGARGEITVKALFVAAGPIEWGSSRMRCYWPAQYMDAGVIEFSELVQMAKNYGQVLEAEVYIWQKSALPELLDAIPGRHWYDICDPIHWFSPDTMREIDKRVDGVVASSPALGSDYGSWAGHERHYCIPDRLEMSHFPEMREHENRDPIRFIWYGVAVNRIALAGAWTNLSRLAANGCAIELTVMDDQPQAPLGLGNEIPVRHVQWTLEGENAEIVSHDIALLPPYPGPWGKVKSNNKMLTAWACGLPVSDGLSYFDMLELVKNPEQRQKRAEMRRADVETLWTVDRSARQWERLLWD